MSNTTASMDGFVPNLGLSVGAVAVPVLSFLTLLIDIPSLVWHIKSHNIPATSLICWIIVSNLMNFVNALIWPNDNIPSWFQGYVLCDIEVKLDLAATLGVAGSLACIMRSLAKALDTTKPTVSLTAAERQRKTIIDCVICFGPPIYMICVHYIVQFCRYYIFATAGCTPAVDNSWPSIALLYIWPVIFCLLDSYYAILVIHRLRKYRREFGAILNSSGSGLNKSRFLRLFFLALILIVIYLPVQGYILYENAIFPLQPYSWTRIHGPEWWDIIMVPTGGSVVFDRWLRIALGFTVFACFGFGREATRMYKSWLLKLGFGRVFPSLTPNQHLPTRTSQQAGRKSAGSSVTTKATYLFIRKFSRDSRSSVSSSSSPSPATTSFAPMASASANRPRVSTRNDARSHLPAIRAGATNDRIVSNADLLAEWSRLPELFAWIKFLFTGKPKTIGALMAAPVVSPAAPLATADTSSRTHRTQYTGYYASSRRRTYLGPASLSPLTPPESTADCLAELCHLPEFFKWIGSLFTRVFTRKTKEPVPDVEKATITTEPTATLEPATTTGPEQKKGEARTVADAGNKIVSAVVGNLSGQPWEVIACSGGM